MIRLSDKKPSHIIAFTVRKADLISNENTIGL